MKYNKDTDSNEIIKINKTKFLLLGFIVGIIPFVILLGLISIKEGGINFIPNVLKDTLVLAGIITACINSITLKNMFINKVKSSIS